NALAPAPPVASGGQLGSPALAPAPPMLVVTSYSSGTLGGNAVPPVVVVPVLTPTPPQTKPAPSQDQDNGSSSSRPSPLSSGGVVGTSTPSGSIPLPAPSPDSELATLPLAGHVQVDGTLDTNHLSMDIVIPLDSRTQAIGVSVRPADGDDP